ncbi:MAG: uroporphyrinogen-III synthase [Micrococcales bacterium]|nr:uroporphyrinogen-III synthase [Micrococcales bacterium]
MDVTTHPRGTPAVVPTDPSAQDSSTENPSAENPSAPKSLSGRTVLLPDSALTTNGALAALLEVGARPLVVPLAEARPVGSTTQLDQALTALTEGRYGWLALTSAASVRMLDARARALFAGDRQLSGLRSLTKAGRLRVASVGQATGAALTALGVSPLVPERGSGPAALIGPLLRAVTDDTPVLFARGNLVGPALAGALRGGGITVDEVVTHITVREEDPPATATAAWACGLVDAVLLTSPKAVRGMIDRLGPPRAGTVVGCVDGVTVEVARASGVPVDVVGTSPTVTSLVDALENRFST